LLDDAAAIAPPPGHELVAKTDAIVGGVHFLHDDPPDLIARKALRVNLSDLAAKGAVPRAYMLDIMLPKDRQRGVHCRFRQRPRQSTRDPLFGGLTVAWQSVGPPHNPA
jgi:thiamine-monophosphate kinase